MTPSTPSMKSLLQGTDLQQVPYVHFINIIYNYHSKISRKEISQ